MLFQWSFTLPKNISWGITEMLLCTYCIGQSPKMRNGNRFWHYCRDSGMIIILASSTVGSVSESFSLSRSIPPSLCICVYVDLQQWMEISEFLSGQTPPESSFIYSSPALLCLLGLPFYWPCLCSHFVRLVVWTKARVWWWRFNMAASKGNSFELQTYTTAHTAFPRDKIASQ